MPPWSAMVIGLMAAVGVTTPTLIVAPLLPAGAEVAVVGAGELPQAARMALSNGSDNPTADPRRRKSRLDRRPATNSSMTCSGIGPRPRRRSSRRSWSMSIPPLLSHRGPPECRIPPLQRPPLSAAPTCGCGQGRSLCHRQSGVPVPASPGRLRLIPRPGLAIKVETIPRRWPNLVARGLRARTTGQVGIIIPGIGNPFFADLLEALESVLYDANLDMILSDSRGTHTDEARRLQTLLDRRVDGLIMIPAGHHSSAPAMRWAHWSVPIVQIDRQVDGLPADYVGVDNALGIRLTLDHLAGQGASTVAFVSDSTASSTGRSRFDAFRLTVPRVPGLEMAQALLGSFSIDFGQEAARQLMRHPQLPDAVVCGSDLVALGVVREFRQSGIAIPDTVK